MDPLSALSITANVAQFVQFTFELFKGAERIYASASGASAASQHLEGVYSRLSELSVVLQAWQAPTSLSDAGIVPSVHWNAVKSLAQGCETDCQELLRVTAKLKTKAGTKCRWWQCFGKALLEVLSREEVRAIERRITEYQASMMVHLCAISRLVAFIRCPSMVTGAWQCRVTTELDTRPPRSLNLLSY